MKTSTLLSAIFLLVLSFSKAQMDDKFYQTSKTMKPFEFSQPVEELKFSVDKDTITAYIAKPEQKDIKKSIIFFHGAAGNVSTYQFMTKPLVESGYQVIMVDVRGYGKSTGVPTHLNVASDSQKLFDFLITRSDIKNTKIYIYGASLGTQVASILAKQNANKLSGLILDSPMESFTEVAKVFAPQYKDVIDKYLVSPYSAKSELKELKGLPKLIIHSQADTTVPYKQGQSVYETAAEPKVFLESKGDHLEALIYNKQSVVAAINKL